DAAAAAAPPQPAAPAGSRGRGGPGCVCRQLASRGGADRPLLRALGRDRAPAHRRRALPRPEALAAGLLPDLRPDRPLQARRPRRRRVRPTWQKAQGGRRREGARGGAVNRGQEHRVPRQCLRRAARRAPPRRDELLSGARALLCPGEEDFGIVPVEAQAAGTPVIAYATGGAAESVLDGRTGVLFDAQSPAALATAIERFERLSLDDAALRQSARRFGRGRFRSELATL